MNTNEIMKDIPGWEGLYAATTAGRIWSHRRQIWLKQCNNRSGGYWFVGLSKDGKVKKAKVSRLVAETFIPNPDNKPEVNHINDKNKDDNSVANLEWATSEENINHGDHNKRVSESRKNIKKVRCIETGEVYKSTKAAAAAINRHYSTLTDCLKGYTKSCAGYHWEYVMEDEEVC